MTMRLVLLERKGAPRWGLRRCCCGCGAFTNSRPCSGDNDKEEEGSRGTTPTRFRQVNTTSKPQESRPPCTPASKTNRTNKGANERAGATTKEEERRSLSVQGPNGQLPWSNNRVDIERGFIFYCEKLAS